MKKGLLLILTCLCPIILSKANIFEVYSQKDFKGRLERFKGQQFHSMWVIFEAKWCPMSKQGLTALKKVLKSMKEDTVLFRVDW
jgi:hypothetical protein